ncbi:MAG: hypothetical protein GY785_07935 [Gammaproteobacteria bacterium]|nr:hypothetical protein [Gammaproteobacteria bacterium]
MALTSTSNWTTIYTTKVRIEAALLFFGYDMSAEHTPWEVGLGFTVNLDKGDFRAELTDANPFEQWSEAGSQDMLQRACTQWKKMLEEYEMPVIDAAGDNGFQCQPWNAQFILVRYDGNAFVAMSHARVYISIAPNGVLDATNSNYPEHIFSLTRPVVWEKGLSLMSEDFMEGPRAFAEKRTPRWKGK